MQLIGAARACTSTWVFSRRPCSTRAIALTINPSNSQALNSRAQALLWMGKDEALAAFSSIPGPVLPEFVEANIAFALFRLGSERTRGANCVGR